MKAVASIYPLVATAFLLFLAFSPSPGKVPRNRKLSRRIGHKHAAFDPLVQQMQIWAEKDNLGARSSHVSWEFNTLAGQFVDTEEYFCEEGKLNITSRLVILFPFLDMAPVDGLISFKELEAWNMRQAVDRSTYRTQKEMTARDKDKDGTITLREYLPHLSDDDIETNSTTHGQAGWWKQQFVNADMDHNGSLNFEEFNDFLHPEDSDNEDIHHWLLREKIKGMDYDSDGRLNFIEFRDQAYDIYKNYIEFESMGDNVPKAKDVFGKLDENMDKLLTERELKPILHQLYPGELSHVKYYTKYLLHEADDNRDGSLSLDEMIDHEDVFYSSVFNEREYEDGDDDDIHDEF